MGSYKSKYSGEQIDRVLDDIIHNNGNAPYIGENGNWFVHDMEKNTFIDSGEKASGEDGKAGITPNIIIGEVATVENLEDASVTRREGTPDEAPILDFSIPRGLSGVYVGSGAMPEGYNIQIDPSGTETEVTISADTIYDLVINNQAEWDAAVTSSFGGAKNVLLNCDIEINDSFSLPTTEITINKDTYTCYMFPKTLKSIAGNGHKINFNLPTDTNFNWAEQFKYFDFNECSLKDIQFFVISGVLSLYRVKGIYNCKCDFDWGEDFWREFYIRSSVNIYNFTASLNGMGETFIFTNCKNLYHCSINGTENCTKGYECCENLISCTSYTYDDDGFYECKNLVGCVVDVNMCNSSAVIGYKNCEMLTNCEALVYDGCSGFEDCSYMSNCKAFVGGGSGFTGANTYCDSETCKEIEIVYE